MNELDDMQVSGLSNELRVLLRATREQRNLSLQQVAESLKISEKSLAFFESEQLRLDALDPFQRGYLRNYASLLGVSLERFQVELSKEAEKASGLQSITQEQRPLIKVNLIWFLKIIGLGLLLWFIVLLIMAGFK